jgi:hypothetical protein
LEIDFSSLLPLLQAELVSDTNFADEQKDSIAQPDSASVHPEVGSTAEIQFVRDTDAAEKSTSNRQQPICGLQVYCLAKW